jgi:hypothetical protein
MSPTPDEVRRSLAKMSQDNYEAQEKRRWDCETVASVAGLQHSQHPNDEMGRRRYLDAIDDLYKLYRKK